MPNNFNFIAPIYDRLATLVFGQGLLKSQIHFLSEIKETDSVLILGGGTGELLEEQPECKQVDFLDLSEKMINRAKERDCKSTVNFIQADFLDHDFVSTYDVIICPFFLDCLEEINLSKAILKCRNLLKGNGRFIVADFDNDRAYPVLLKLMYLFFRITAHLESSRLLDIQEVINGFGLKQIQTRIFRKGIFSSIYRKGLRW